MNNTISRFGAESPLHHPAMENDIDFEHKTSLSSQHKKLDDGPLRVTLSVGGMTCSSCSGTITKIVSDLQGVSEVAVSFLGRSASAIVDHINLVDVIVETVNDSGYEAEVIGVEPLNVLDNDSISNSRTIALHIDGMFCP
jgi:P-type Cu+ transporter